MEELIIEHQRQGDKNCLSASVAMVLGKSVEEVTEDLHAEFVRDSHAAFRYLDKHGVRYKIGTAFQTISDQEGFFQKEVV